MKTCVRIGTLVIALGIAGLFSGCVNQSPSAYHRQPARDFEVVETSTKRQLTDREMAYLRAKVADYLAQQGQTGSGDYYVKIYLGEETGVDQGEWVIVRYTRYSTTRFSLLASYPTYSYPTYPHYSYDYYPFGWYGYSGFSFRYYDDPYYYGYYPWSVPRYGGHGRAHDRKPDRDPDHDNPPPRVGGRPSGALKPSFVPAHMDPLPGNGNAPAYDRPHRSGGDVSRHDGSRDNPRQRRNNADTPGMSSGDTSRIPTAASGSAEPSRPSTRSTLHRDRAAAEAMAPHRTEASGHSGYQDRGGRDYSPPVQSTRSSESRSNESSRQDQSSSNSAPSYSTSSSNSSSQPATRSELHDGGRTARDP